MAELEVNARVWVFLLVTFQSLLQCSYKVPPTLTNVNNYRTIIKTIIYTCEEK